MEDITALGQTAGSLLKTRKETIAIAESSAGGLISATLLAVPGASAFYLGGGVVYTARAREALFGIKQDEIDSAGLRSATEPYVALLAERCRAVHAADWGIAESGASGPSGNRYGDPAGHTVLAISGVHDCTRSVRTGNDNRDSNMSAFTRAALKLLIEILEIK
tara:strand:- start:149 stop:640 length:492 start_codon:yes stop_codon:yes gene_type:complete